MIPDFKLGDTGALIKECHDRGLLRNQCAYVLATAYWETAQTMKPVKEAYWLSEQWRKDNLRYYPWYGRGYVQLTWEENYAKAQGELGIGTVLTADPDNALKPEYATQIIVQGMIDGWFTGKKLSDYITLQASDFYNARRIVNGTDKASTIADIAKAYDAALLADGYGVEGPDEPEVEQPTLEDLVAEWRDLVDRVATLEAQVAELEAENGSPI